MKKIYFVLFIFGSGCSGLQFAQNESEAIKLYGADCTRSGYEERTEPYADCIRQAWKIVEEKKRSDEQRKEMLLMIKGSGMLSNGTNKRTNLPWR